MNDRRLKFFPAIELSVACILGLFSCGYADPFGPSVSAQKNYPIGIFALTKGGRPIPEKLLTNPALTGIVVRNKWSHLEPVEGQYDWGYFDNQFARVSRQSKQISLILSYGGSALPDWLLKKNIRFFKFINSNSFSPSYSKQISIPLFWDAEALAYKKRLIADLGKRYAGYPGLVLVTAQCTNALTGDWNIPKTRADIQQWRNLGYSAEKLINACREIIDATMKAFPNQIIKMAVGPVPAALGDKPKKVATTIIQYTNNKYPGRFIAQRNNLSATTPDPRKSQNLRSWQVIWDNRPAVAAQMLWHAADITRCRLNGKRKPCDSATMLQQAIDIGLAYQVRYLEIYAKDILRPYGKQIIRKTSQIMRNNQYSRSSAPILAQ